MKLKKKKLVKIYENLIILTLINIFVKNIWTHFPLNNKFIEKQKILCKKIFLNAIDWRLEQSSMKLERENWSEFMEIR